MHMVEEASAQLEEEQTISEHQDSPVNDKGPTIANSAASWSKPKIGSFQFSDHMSDMGKEDVTLTAKPMEAAFPKVVDDDETLGGGDVGEGAVDGAAEQGTGQMKLEAPPRFNGKRPRVREWLVDIRRWMQLMRYPPEDWVDIVATRCEGAASAWMNSTMQEINKGSRPAFEMWSEFCDAFATAFESITNLAVQLGMCSGSESCNSGCPP